MRTTQRERDAVRAAVRELGWGPCELRFAVGFVDRLLGMIFAPARSSAGMLSVMAFPRCRSVHTCFMPYAIDAAFISHAGEVMALYEAVPPWRIVGFRGSWAVLERASTTRPHRQGAPQEGPVAPSPA